MHAQNETRLVVAVRFPRRKRLRQILILPGLVAVLTGLRLEPALGWGSFMGGGYDTHQRIEAKAYAALVSDPAFYPGALPSLDELQKYAGMTVKEGKTFGLGPDVDGNSRYAEHWYNPRTGEGDGPQAVSSYALHSVELKRADAKMTEWGAHYLADMSTPVHINGATFKTIFEIYSKTNQADTNAPVLLSSNITGFVSYAELHPTLSDTLFHRRSPNWRPEIKRFIAAHLEDKEHVDFFDPWYWDSETKPATTHAQWEMRVPELSGKVPVYSTDWENGKEDFYRYAAIYAEQAAKFAGKAAANTLTINREIQAGQQSSDIALAAMETAVVNVYTLWRGSFSALRPGILIEYPAENDGKKMIKVTGVVTNCAAEQVTKVRCRLSYWDPHESVIRNKPVVSYGSISGISQGVKTGQKVGEWFLESDVSFGPDQIPSNIKLEVIGVFEHTPDLQYALTTDVRLESPPQIEVTGPWATTAKEGEALDFGVAVEAKNTAGKEALKNAHIEWYVNAPLIQSGSCNQSCKWIASTPGTYNISAILFSRINGKDKPLAFKRGEVTVTADKNKGAAVEPPSPVGTFTAAKEYHGWMTLRVTVGTVTKFKSEDRPGWKNNGTGFTAASVGSGPVTIKIEAIIGKGGSSYFDYAGNVSVKAADGTILAAEKLLIPKDGGNKTCSVVWTPTAKQDSVSVAVGLTGGNPEYYTFFVSGSIGKGTAQAVSAAASTAPAIPLPTVIPTTPTPTPTPPPLVTIPVAPPSTYATPISQTVVRTGNMGGVDNRPTAPTHFTATESYVVTDISTYHWNYGRGTPAPGTIGLRHSDGTLYGPWRAKGTPGQGGVENAIWIVAPNVALKAGIYTLVDSDPNTWSQNAQSGGRGHAEVKAYAARLAPATPQPVVQANRGEPVNLALRKPATQSSTYDHDSATYGPQLGVDGKTNETWLTGFFHTALENAPWWQVDLQKIHVIGEIRVFNRTQQLAERARTIQVQISLNGTDWIIIHRHDGSPWTRLFLPVGGKSARFVRVQLTGEHYLHLKEIEVYGVNEASPR